MTFADALAPPGALQSFVSLCGEPAWKRRVAELGVRTQAGSLLGRIAQEKNATPAQIALAWLLAQKPWMVPIPGTRKVHRLDENINAVAVELTPDDLREIGNAASKLTIEGARYPEHLERMTNR